MINCISEFIAQCKKNPGHEADIFKTDCTDHLRDHINALADLESSDPFRSAMIFLRIISR